MLTKLKSFLKAICGNIWPTTKPFMPKFPDGFIMPSPSEKLMQRYGIMGGIASGLAMRKEKNDKPEYSPHEQLDIKLTDDLTWLKSMVGAYLFWEKNSYEVWREEGMFYIALPNRITGTMFCATSCTDVLNMALNTIREIRNELLQFMSVTGRKNDNPSIYDGNKTKYHQHDEVGHFMSPDDYLINPKYVMGCDPIPHYKADILEHYARYWKEGIGYLPDFLKPQPLSGDVSEQSVILPKMDEIQK